MSYEFQHEVELSSVENDCKIPIILKKLEFLLQYS